MGDDYYLNVLHEKKTILNSSESSLMKNMKDLIKLQFSYKS